MEEPLKTSTQETSGRSKPHILSLPNEIQVQILSNLSINDQLNACGVSSHWKCLLLEIESLTKSRYPVRLDMYPEDLGLHALLNCGEYTLKLLVKDGAIIRIYHSPNIHPIPDSETPADFIWLFTEERENGMREGYFDVTDSPFLNETSGTPFSYDSYDLNPKSEEEKVLLEMMQGLDDGSAYYVLKFLTFVPSDVENGIVDDIDTDEDIHLEFGTLSVKEVMELILKKAKEAVEDEAEVDLGVCGGMYLVEVVFPELRSVY
ncbi:hypothetical protein TWF718_008355 [Orbilia javanica]|uniref:F-box domain-containing protein n=1 Tax=Orbilia javanica TaxID=47235 RepID=A0AAN8N566_9PEZI